MLPLLGLGLLNLPANHRAILDPYGVNYGVIRLVGIECGVRYVDRVQEILLDRCIAGGSSEVVRHRV